MTPKEVAAKIEDMPSYILDDDLIIYHRYVTPLTKQDEIVDVGTGWGKSAVAMSLFNRLPTLFTIDDGSYPIYQKWAKDQNDYRRKLQEEFHKHGIVDIQLLIADVFDNYIFREDEYALIHIDLTKESEVEGVKTWLPCVKIGGLILIRNFERMHEEIEPLLHNFDYIDQGGLITVLRRIR